jgi:hypothetical protein
MKPEVTKGLGSRESALAENVTQANAPVATTAATERGKFDPVTVDPSVRTDRSAVTRTSQAAASEVPVVVSLGVSHDAFVDLASTMLDAKQQLDRSGGGYDRRH